MEKTSSKAVLSNLIWRFLERFGAELVQFVVSIVLARILEPTHYGTVALMNVFIVILTVFVKDGFNAALIQKKNADDLDFSTVFYAQAVLCLVMYTGLFFAAPLIASFYDDLAMTPMIRVLGLTLIIGGVKNVQIVGQDNVFKIFVLLG